jgi:hypothetical protein
VAWFFTIGDGQLHQEAVELGLGQRIGALRFDGVLRGHHDERLGKGTRDAVDRDLVILHRLEERRLRLRRGAVDLVGEEELAEDGAGDEREGALLAIEHARARDVARHEIGRELQALEARARHPRERPRDERLAEAGRTLDEHVTARERGDEQPEHEIFLPDDDLRHLRADAMERRFERLGGHERVNNICYSRPRWRRYEPSSSGPGSPASRPLPRSPSEAIPII